MSDQPRGNSSRTSAEMTTPSAWGSDQKLKAALDDVGASLGRLKDGKRPKGLEDHVATIESAASGLLKVVTVGSSGGQVRGYLAQFTTKTTAAAAAIKSALDQGNMSVGLAVSLLESVQRLDKLAQTL